MDALAVIISAALGAIAFMHLFWAFGMTWPGKTPAELSSIVVGAPGAEEMPDKFLTGFVAILIFLAAFWPLFWRAIVPYPVFIPQTLIWLGMWVLVAIFLLRGLGGFFAPMVSDVVEPFKRLNKLYYSPLCIVLGLGFLTLVLEPVG